MAEPVPSQCAQNSLGNASMSDAADSKYSATNNSRVPAGRQVQPDPGLHVDQRQVMADAPGGAVDEYEAGCRRSDESADAHRSTPRPRQPTHRE